jgi:hypothetical protein
MRKLKVLAGLVTALMIASGVYAQVGAPVGGGVFPPAPVTLGPPQAVVVPTALSDATVVVTVDDISGTIDRVGNNILSKFSAFMSSSMIKTMLLGTMVQDPTLVGLNNGKSAMVGLFKSGAVYYVEVEQAQAQAYQTVLKQSGNAVELAEGMLAGGSGPEMAAGAVKLAGQAKELLGKEKRTPSIKATINMPKLLASYDNEIKQGIKVLTNLQTPNMSQQTIMGQIQIGVLLAAAKDVDTLSVQLTPDEKGNLLSEVRLKAKAGSNLAAFLDAKGGDTAGLVEMLPGKGAIRATASVSTAAYLKLVEQYADVAFKDLGTAKADQEAYLAMMSTKQNVTGDAAAMEFLVPGQKGLTGFTITHVTNPAEAVTGMEKSLAQAKESLKTAKMDIEFKKDVRKYKDVSVHQFALKQGSDANMPAQITQLLNSIQVDFAVVGDLVISAMGGQSLDTLIDNVQAKKSASPTALVAPAQLGAGGKTYVDVYVDKLLKFAFDTIGPQMATSPYAEIPAGLDGVTPITFAVFSEPGAMVEKSQVPADLFVKLGAEYQKAVMKSSGAGNGGPGAGMPMGVGAPGAGAGPMPGGATRPASPAGAAPAGGATRPASPAGGVR